MKPRNPKIAYFRERAK